MELKPYQQTVINDLRTYLSIWAEKDDPALAFREFWQTHPRTPLNVLQIEKYKANVPQVPHVCLKVPTAGGKTFIACNAIKAIFDSLPIGKAKVVIWLVPSITILDQTIANLKNPAHPYRQKIDTHFGGRVEVYSKEDALMGVNFSPTTIKEQLSIIVGSFSSFKKSKNKDARKVFQENSNLADFAKIKLYDNELIDETDETALIQVLNKLNPVVIVDESHNAESELSIDMLLNLNPSLVLDLTATPKENSNIISYTDAWQLKKENMVKLPVIVYNHYDAGDVITNSVHFRNQLEKKALEEQVITGRYIRPIVLFQAQTKNEQDENTFKKIKERLVKAGIPEEQIAIKTAEINEIKNIDLNSPDCAIRYIITINALKEGWDCPFAYILATLANRSSAVDVEQILGRILRQPYVMQHKDPMLNMSYVFTSSTQFRATLDNIIQGLNRSGFSKNDYRLAGITEQEIIEQEVVTQLGMNATDNATDDVLDLDHLDIQLDNSISLPSAILQIEQKALEENRQFIEKIQSDAGVMDLPADLFNKVKSYPLKEAFIDEALKIKLPQFFVPKAASLFDDSPLALLQKKDLVEGFELKRQSTAISFENVALELYEIDIDKDQVNPSYKKVQNRAKEYLLQSLQGATHEKQINVLTNMILSEISIKFDEVTESDLKKYICRVIEDLDDNVLNDLKQNPNTYAYKIRNQIQAHIDAYTEKQFYTWLDTNEVRLEPSFAFTKSITPSDAKSGIVRSLYESEGNMNNFEWHVINTIANMGNTMFWHRNIEQREFALNAGFVNHYPDFIIYTQKKNIIVLETKGDHLGNEDSAKKLRLGNTWANMAGSNYKYFMVFNENPINDAHTLDDFIRIYKEL